MFCCTLLYVHSSIAIILMGKRELVALLNLSSRCLAMVERLLLAVPQGCLRFVIVVFPDHTHLLFLCDRPLVQHGFSNTYVVTKVNVGNFHSQLKSYKTVIYCNFGRHKDLSMLKSDIHLGLIKVHVNITLSGRYILMCTSLTSILV